MNWSRNSLLLSLTAMLMLAMCLGSAAQDINLGIVSETLIGGNNYVVTHEGNYAFIATGHGVKIYECSNPVDPTFVTSFPTNGIAINLAVVGNNLFVCDTPNGLFCYDISDVFNPIMTDSLSFEGFIRSATPHGDYLYVCMETMGLNIVDWSNPNDMQLMNTLFVGGEVSNAVINDDILYIALGVAGMAVYDISDPVNPVYPWIWNITAGRCTDMFFFESENCMALSDGWNGVHLLDLEFPWVPAWYATVEEDSLLAGWLTGGDDWGMVSYPTLGFKTFDIDGDELDLLDVYNCAGLNVYGDYVYTCFADSGFGIVNCTDPSNLVIENSILNSRPVLGGTLYDDILYVINRNDGIAIMDVSDPANPTQINSITTGRFTLWANVIPEEQLLYASDFFTGIHVFDITDPVNPTSITTVSTDPDTGTTDFIIIDDLMYVAVENHGFNIFDVSEPTNPTLTWAPSDYTTGFSHIAVTADGQTVISSTDHNGLSIWSVNSPSNVTLEYETEIIDYATGMYLNGDYLYITDLEDGLYVLDVSNPYYIFKRDSLELDQYGTGLSFFGGDYLVVSDHSAGIKLVDVSDPDNIYLVDSHDTYSYAWGAVQNGDYLYLGDNYSLITFNVYSPPGVGDDDPVEIPNSLALLHPAYPNPFNPSTTLSFSLAKQGQAKIILYNVAGEKITDLYDDYAKAGNHRFSLNAEGLASGIYFATLEAHQTTQTQKLLYVK
ncbi:T9SS type A sorting domain-containing protein [bacterium]|nr:T9SS type A sorting domain-containing protein [bacterium]